MRKQPAVQQRRRQRGVSLIELMIAMTLGVVVLIALTTLYVQSSRSRNASEHITRQIESGRYALQVMAMDLENAGYYAEFDPRPSPTNGLTLPTSPPDPCDTTLANLRANLVLPVQGYDDSIASASRSGNCNNLLGDQRPGTDVLVVRRASGCVAGTTGCDALAANDYVFQASLCNNSSELGHVPAVYYWLDLSPVGKVLHKKNCTTQADPRRFLTSIYFIANNNKANDGVPTLKRFELGPPGGFTAPAVALADNVENLQIEYGVDNTTSTSATGAPIAYTASPDTYNGCNTTTPPTCTPYWQAVVAARIYVVARSNQGDPGYTDTKTYNLGLKADGTTANTYPNATYPLSADEKHYERHVYETVVRLKNPSYRNSTQ